MDGGNGEGDSRVLAFDSFSARVLRSARDFAMRARVKKLCEEVGGRLANLVSTWRPKCACENSEGGLNGKGRRRIEVAGG